MTAVQWLIDNLEKYEDYAKISWRCLGEIEIALEIEKEQIIGAYWEGGENIQQAEQYYNETYGSSEHIVDTNEMIDHIGEANEMVELSDEQAIEMLKDMNKQPMRFHCVPKEIPDDDIEDVAWEKFITDSGRFGFISGAKWYREQLKQRQ